jgi:predicted lipoprotein with Yx(FWY)xxD motif
MRRPIVLLISGLLALSACGGGDETDRERAEAAPPRDSERAEREPPIDAADGRRTAEGDGGESRERPEGTTVRARGSEFGRMLFDADRQAIYIFEKDPKGRSVCYGECAKAWPPVLTDGEPVAGAGVKARLLGTVERRDGRVQVTYAGKPLYFYAHEAPGEVRCHNVNLNGGFWWVVGPDGKRRP